MKWSTIPAIALTALLLTGCGGLLDADGPARSVWWLEPAEVVFPPGSPPLVVQVTVIPGLDTDRILNLDDGARLNSYAGAHWPDFLPEVLTSLIARSLETTGTVPVRIGDRAGPGECLVRLEARAFQGRVNAESVTTRVDVSFAGTIECGETVRTVSTEQRVGVSDNRMSAIVAAFQGGLERSLEDLAGQVTAP